MANLPKTVLVFDSDVSNDCRAARSRFRSEAIRIAREQKSIH
jgi:hypothetical protein